MDEQPVRRPAYWAVLPAEIRYDPELPAAAKILYAEISSLTSERGYCYATNRYFMELYGMSESTLQRHLRKLEQRGCIVIHDGDGGSKIRKIYAGVNPLAQTPRKNEGGPLQKCGGSPRKNEGDIKKESKKEDQNHKPPSGGKRVNTTARRKKAVCEWKPELFERFWRAYPRGEDKAAARYEWDEIRPTLELMKEMSAALSRQKESEEWRRGVGIPYACRWLRDRRWEDELRAAEEPEQEPEVVREWI